MATGFKHGIELLLFFGLHFENVFLDGLTRNQFVIVDDLLATGGTVKCISNLIQESGKKILGLSIVVELKELKARETIPFPVESQIIF